MRWPVSERDAGDPGDLRLLHPQLVRLLAHVETRSCPRSRVLRRSAPGQQSVFGQWPVPREFGTLGGTAAR